jgi:hypothetical protein
MVAKRECVNPTAALRGIKKLFASIGVAQRESKRRVAESNYFCGDGFPHWGRIASPSLA